MHPRVFSISRILNSAIAVGMALIGLGLLLVAAPRSRISQAESGESQTSKSRRQSRRGNLVVLASDVREKTIRFGDELVVVVTLQNQGAKPIRIPPDALLLNNERWIQGSGWGSGYGESTLARTGIYGKDEFTLQPGELVTLTGGSVGLGSHSMGSMKAEFVIQTEDEGLRRELGTPQPFAVSYYVAPSKLMTSAWAAKTSEERKRLQPEIRELLLLASKAESSGFYVLQTLEHLGCQALSLLGSAMRDSEPLVREQAIRALERAPMAAENLNSLLSSLNAETEGRSWAASVERCDDKRELQVSESVKLAITMLSDQDRRVRIAAMSVLARRASYESSLRRWMAENPRWRDSADQRTKELYDSVGIVDPALPLVKKLASDPDPGVRAEAQKFLSNFTSQQSVAGGVVASLSDPDAGVRNQALQALKTSHELPSISTIEKAVASTKGDVGVGLIELVYEREDSDLATRLTPRYQERSAAERLMILTAIAGHADEAALKLIGLGLKDADKMVRRAALMRLLVFPTEKAISLMKTEHALRSDELAIAVERELKNRSLFPFLARAVGSQSESTFPSFQGTGPVVSPDGKWVAYVETGWGRPGGSGGLGSSNLLSITHVARSNGSSDRIVSDMFLVGWMSDSRRVATARDGFAAILDLNGKPVVEFGGVLDKPYTGTGITGEVWPRGDMRQQFGVRMPHSRRFPVPSFDSKETFDYDWGEDSACSPDGKWFGPRRVKDKWQFVDSGGNKIELIAPDRSTIWSYQAVWAPDGSHIIVFPTEESGSFASGKAIERRKAYVIDVGARIIKSVVDIDQVWGMGGWNYRKGRWNPWSKDGTHLALVRQGQVWISDAEGNATQITFDASNKVFPTFSPDGTKIAYITWQFDNREHYTRLGPTDIWVVDIKTGIAVRVTRADADRISGIDWLDNSTLIYDRLGPDDRHSTLRTLSLR